MNAGNDGGFFLRHAQIQKLADGAEPCAELCQQRPHALACPRRNSHGMRVGLTESVQAAGAGDLIHLIEDHQHRLLRRADLRQHRVHGHNLFRGLRMADVHHMQ